MTDGNAKSRFRQNVALDLFFGVADFESISKI